MEAGFGRGGRRSLRVSLSLWDDTIHGNSPGRRSRCGDEASRYQPRTRRAAPGVTVIDKKGGEKAGRRAPGERGF